MNDLLAGTPARYNPEVAVAAWEALLDGKPRRVVWDRDGKAVVGRVWEIYRSIETDSLRVRISDRQGLVYHANTMWLREITPLEALYD